MVEYKFDEVFPRYTIFTPKVPVYCVTPNLKGAFHRFFDTSPISPSGRYLCVTSIRDESKVPCAGEAADVFVVDLLTGKNVYHAETFGWDTQLGAQAQWGRDDTQLFYNDMDTTAWRAYALEVNIFSGMVKRLQGTVYMAAPNGDELVSPCLCRIGRTQAGYGVHVPPQCVPKNEGMPWDDGIFLTDVKSGEQTMLISYAEILKKSGGDKAYEEFGPGDFYGFHVKYNLQGTRIMLVLRMLDAEGKTYPALFSISRDRSEVNMTIPPQEWARKGGHHPNWCPDGIHAMMNLKISDNRMQIVKARYDGTEYGVLANGVLGTGHPTLHPNGKTLVTDTYLNEEPAYGDGTTPIRLINQREATVKNIIRIPTRPAYAGPKNELRVDPHPAWDPSYRYLIFNAFLDGTRRVLVADLQSVL